MAAPGPGAHDGSGDASKMPDLAALQNLQSMDWLLKKERIFLLAQFWQQRAALAENEVHSLKEQLDTFKHQKTKENINNNNMISSTNTNNNNTINNNNNTSKNRTSERECKNSETVSNPVESTENNDSRCSPIDDRLKTSRESEVSQNGGAQEGTKGYNEIVSKLVEDITRLQAALSGVKEATAVQMHALEEQLELKNRLIHRLELKLENSKDQEEIKRELGSGRESRGSLEGGLGLPPRSLEGLLIDRKLEHEIKVPSSEFGNSLSHFGPTPFPHPLRHPLHPQLGTPLAPPPLVSPLQPLAPHPPPGTPLHHLLGEEWRKSYERSAMDRHSLVSGQMSPDSGGMGGAPSAGHSERSESRESPSGDVNMKSPSSLPNGYGPESKSPFQSRDDRSPFKDDMHPLAFKFEDRITGESLIPKGDPMEARLQELLRFNMEKYCHQNLDTLNIARRVRELLSIHNIGQRLFAKYILGLSQGTVSELLSKPKPWDKLTEKGRDSYRKMHAWAMDDSAVYLLKTLIPKKGSHKDGGLRTGEETVTEERIQHILSEASRAMTSVSVAGSTGLGPIPQPPQPQPQPPPQQQQQHQQQQQQQPTQQQPPIPVPGANVDQDSRSTDSKSPASSIHSPSPLSREGRLRARKEGEDTPQDKVARLYQEELFRLMSRSHHHEPHLPLPRDSQYPGLLFPFLGQSFLLNRGPEEMKLALDAYHQEMSKLQGAAVTGMGLGAAGLGIGGHPGLGGIANTPPMSMGMSLGAGGHNGAQDLSMPKRDHRNGDEDEDGNSSRLPAVASPFGVQRMKPENSVTTMSTASPLTSLVTPITSIASVSSTSSTSSNGSGIEDPSSTTASPLQRMASITNSLVTGPPMTGSMPMNQKPMKAILPPITQQQFDQYSSMNTEDIVKKIKEQLSQYSISQRLFGESVLGLSQGSVSDLLARPKPWHMLTQKGREPFIRMKMFLEDDNAVHKLVASQYKIAPEKLMRTGGYGVHSPSTSKPHHIKLPPDLPKTSLESPLPPVGIPPSSLGLSISAHPHPYDTRMPLLDPLRKVFPFQTGLPNVRVPGPVAPSVYEMAALTQDLDTQVITTKIKEALLANNIGQKLFGEAVLGLSQGSVSELLSKPKPWHMLSIKGREPFIRMQLWLNDPHNVEKLQTLKNERREANKRRRGLDPTADVSQDSHDVFQAPSPGGSSKKARVLFSEEQKEALRLAFALDPYPNLAAIEFLSQELQLSTRTITNWFHNHRMRLKQQPGSPDGGISSPPRDLPNPSQTSFDPLHFRIMLSQRLMELRKEKGLPPTLPGLGAGLPTSIHPGFFSPIPPFSMASLNASHSDRYATGGLDLSMKAEHEGDDSNNSYIDDDSNISGGMSPNGNRSDGDDFADDQDGHGSSSPVARPSSRRKPAAPQWVNPSWAVGTGEKEREVIINGVCVMQTDDYRQNSEQETVLIEPTSVEEARRSMFEAGGTATPDGEDRTCPPSSDIEVAGCPVTIKGEESVQKEEDNELTSLPKVETVDINGGDGGGEEYQSEVMEEQPQQHHQVKSDAEDA